MGPPVTMLAPLLGSESVSWRLNCTDVPYFGSGLDAGATPLSLAAAAAHGMPLFRHMFGADPCARVIRGKLWLYVSHDPSVPHKTQLRSDAARDGATDMSITNFEVFSASSPEAPLLSHGVALSLSDVPWASKVIWAPDVVAGRNGKVYLYFPAIDKYGDFRVGVAIAEKPEGPFRAEPAPVEGTFSIDPHVFVSSAGVSSLYFGGLWGGQLEKWKAPSHEKFTDGRALGPQRARLSDDFLSLASEVREMSIRDDVGIPINASDTSRRFFEATWLFERNDLVYLVYSTGDTHLLVYATATNSEGPFTYRGQLLPPVLGWSTHPAVVQFGEHWWLIFQDATLSGGATERRNLKVARLTFTSDGSMAVEQSVRSRCQPETANWASTSGESSNRVRHSTSTPRTGIRSQRRSVLSPDA